MNLTDTFKTVIAKSDALGLTSADIKAVLTLQAFAKELKVQFYMNGENLRMRQLSDKPFSKEDKDKLDKIFGKKFDFDNIFDFFKT